MTTAKKAAKKAAAGKTATQAGTTAPAKKAAKKTAAKKTTARKTAIEAATVVAPATATADDTPIVGKQAARAAKTAAVANAPEVRKTVNPDGSWPFPTNDSP